MLVPTIAVAVLLHLTWGASIGDVTCPDSCTCQLRADHLETSCTSYEFFKKLLPKQESTIVRLSINNASLVNVDLKLKYLKNLLFLDLSGNNIATLPPQFPYLPKLKSFNVSNNKLRGVSFAQLPKNLQEVDLSHNAIASFPKDWSHLKQLKVLHFHDNPIDCDCDNLAIYEQLLKGDIVVSENLTCYSPIEFHGRTLGSVNCSMIKDNLLNSMLGDDMGSGSDEGDTLGIVENEEFIEAKGVSEHREEEEVEGSGDEGSGEIPILPIDEHPKACHFNCSTPKPVGSDDEKDASPPPPLGEQAKMLFEDIVAPESVHTVAATPRTDKELQIKEEPTNFNETSDKGPVDNEVELIPTNDTVLGEMERASFDNSNSQSVYIIVGLLVAFVALLIIYIINKKKGQRKRNRKRNKSNENGYGEEMKPLGKSAEAAKPREPLNSKLPETAPLLNGQNGKIAEDTVKSPPDEENDMESVELRKPERHDSLTPQPERVTIKAAELPDSIPKTPIFVHRQLNSEGGYDTTAVNSD